MGRKALFTFLFFLVLLTSASSASVALEEVVEDAAAAAASEEASVMIGLRTFESLIDDLLPATIGAP